MIKPYLYLGLIIAFFVALTFIFPGLRQFSSPTYVRDFFLDLGKWGYLVYALSFLLSIPLPIPSTPLTLGGGYVYGTIIGTILALVGLVIGGSISFFMVRHFGKPLVEKMVDRHHIIHFNHLFKKRGEVFALIAYAIPLFPSDTTHFLLGLTQIRYSSFLKLMIVGSIPRYLLINSLGQDLHQGITWVTIIIIFCIIAMIIVAIEREKIKRFLFKELKEVEQEVQLLERKMEHSRN